MCKCGCSCQSEVTLTINGQTFLVEPEGGVGVRAEKAPERVLSARQVDGYEGLVRALTKAEQAGQLDALKRRFR